MVEPARHPLARRRKDLDSLSTATGGSVVVDSPLLAQVNLRAGPEIAERAPYPLPMRPNTSWETDERTTLWLGPDEWLVLGPAGTQTEIVRELEVALRAGHRSIVDVTANRVILELSGTAAKELLSFGCSLDLHPRSWADGSCAQTLLAGAQVILHERLAATRVLVRPSFADHVVDWMLEVSTPFRSPAAPE